MLRGRCANGVLFALAFALSLAPRFARAEPPSPASDARPFHLSYDATLGSCPDAPAFLGAVRARTERARLALEGESATSVGVRIAPGPDGQVVGALTIREPDGTRQERTMASDTCVDVAKAIALVVALVLDPDADTSADPQPIAPPAPPPPPPPTPPVRSPPVPRSPPPASPFALGVGGEIGALGGIGPSVAPSAGAIVDVERSAAGPSWLRPSARLSIDIATTSADRAAGAQRYLWLAGTLSVCPVQLPLTTALRIAPCLGLQAGMHEGTTSGLPNARSTVKPWVAPTGAAAVRWEISERLTLELLGGMVLPLVKTRFFLAPDVTLFRVPAVTAMAAVSAIVRFR